MPALPPPGWYPDAAGQMRWWDGLRWQQAAGEPNKSLRMAMGVVASVLVVVGAICAIQSVSLLTGTTTVWVGVALVVAGAVISCVPRLTHVSIRIIAIVVAVLCIANAVWDEVQLNDKRHQLEQMFDN